MSTTDDRLTRVLDTSTLARVVPHLSPESLHQLVQHRGLDACGELVTLATPAQLTSLLDLDLWRHAQPGRDEQFDVDRFGEWLEVLVDTGDSVAARTIAALDQELVVAGLSRYLRVFDPGTFEPIAQSDDEAVERHDLMNFETNRDVLECEVGGYLVRARRTDAWDAIVALLVALEIEHHHKFHALMRGVCTLSYSRPEVDGLDDLLIAPEQHLYDVAVERQHRQALRGYATPADARAFLQMARQPPASAAAAMNPIAAAYFREVDGDATRALTPFVPNPAEATSLARSRELAFLANALLMGCSVQSRPFTIQEASDAATCICNLGLAQSPGAALLPDAFLEDRNLVTAFEVGWSILHRDVSLFVADSLIATLAGLRSADADTFRDLRALRRRLVKEREAGTPWLARDAAEVLTMLDMSVWISVVGLLDECPVLPAAVTAVVEHRTSAISQTAFEFISTPAQIGGIRVFMRMLPGLLSR
jgi:hypothetical protein